MRLAASKREFCLELFDGGEVPVPISLQPRSVNRERSAY
jgi:hypothetical protein